MSTPKLLGVVRMTAGVALIAAPAPSLALLLDDERSRDPLSRTFGRMLGGRDIAVGAALLAAPDGGVGQRSLLGMAGMVDVVDAVAIVIAFPHLRRFGRWASLAIALASAADHFSRAARSGDQGGGDAEQGLVAPAGPDDADPEG